MKKAGNRQEKKSKETAKQAKAAKEVFVVGIGASAGGTQAMGTLFSSVPNDSVAYVIVQHLSSEHRSILRDIVASQSVLEVVEAQHNMPVEVNKVYVIPHNKELTIKQNYLQLHDKTVVGRARTIDTFFRSLAADKGQRSIGIIMSGTGTDGTEGIIAIKKAGGVVLVQDPQTAKFDSMPRNAISTGYVDYILPPEAMPQEIFNIVKVLPLTNKVTELVNSETESSFTLILEMIHERTGIDFSNYKRPTIIRRISRRMALTNIVGLIDYLDYLHLHPEEVEALSRDFLIGVTKFFRDKGAYEVLATEVVPAIIEGKKTGQQLRVWVAGCSTGEEAYSIAILIREYLDKAGKELEVKVFASDIDREALDFAGKGLYPPSSLSEVSEERLKEFFVEEEGKYRIRQRVRRMVIFAPHNVINDPPFSKMDLVSCRNMLIYLNPVLQKKVLDKFHYALLIGGYLFLGTSESIGDIKSFKEVNKKWKIYRNMEPAHALGLDTIINSSLGRKSNFTAVQRTGRDLTSKQAIQQTFTDLLNETILDEYGYAAVFVDEHYDVLHGEGRFKNYLDLPEQNFTFNLLKLVPSDLSASLSTLLRKAVRDREKLTVRGLQVRDGDKLRYINVVIKPYLSDKKHHQRLILVVFNEDRPGTTLDIDPETLNQNDHYDDRMQELEAELQHTKEDLQTVVEELETSNEELQSTNEELLSSNEELQSTNEELQSLNEELHTINMEHQYKIRALMELDDDLNNYFRSTDIGQIFVDRKLIIRKYTPAATRLINLIESDIGRSIYHISNNLRYEQLLEDVRHVIASNRTIEKEVQDRQGEWYQMRVLPYITQEHKIDGAIIIFVQINELKNLQLLHAGILDSSPNAILGLKAIRDQANKITDFALRVTNHKAQELLGYAERDLIGKALSRVNSHLLEEGLFEKFVQVAEAGGYLDVEVLQPGTGTPQWLHVMGAKFDDGLVLTLQDITERKLYEHTLKEQQEEIKANAERFRTMLEAVPHITWTNKPNGESNTFNKFWYEYTGLSQEDSRGWGWEKAFQPDDLKVIMPHYLRCLETGEVLNAEARILRRSDGQHRWHLIKNVPLRNEEGAIELWIGTATDIQDQKDAEETNIQLRLSQQREILNAVLETQETERARISEALHNGLGQLLYAAKLHLDQLIPGSAEQKVLVERVNQLLSQSIEITRDISHELMPSVLRTFGLKTAVEEMISLLTSDKLRITSEISNSAAQLDYNLALSLYRIVQELLNNIVKHSQATKALVKITVEDKKLFVRIEDNGIGTCNDMSDSIAGGGLKSVENRVKLMGGRMTNLSAEGKGCVFEITCTV
ncbi:MAG: PAS domain-containing protein [Hymenobacteraceae bacterium]|nr:PAS domain-containing protein [Hymenobacteraceae bacterium]